MEEHPQQLEKEHVYEVYSQIAEHFSDTRYKPWPRIAQFLRDQPIGSLIVDVGCGNGKYLGVNPQTYTIGSDICPELVVIGHSRKYEVAVCDCLNLPYRSNQFDAAICIAVVHHLSTEERRVQALRELARIVRPGGRMLVYVWAMEQERKKFTSQDVLVPWHLQPKYRGGQLPCGGETKERIKPKKWRKRKQKRKLPHGRAVEASGAQPVEGEGEGYGEGENSVLLGELAGLTLSGEEEEEEGSETIRSTMSEVGTLEHPPLDTCTICAHHSSQEMPATNLLEPALQSPTDRQESMSTGVGSGDQRTAATPCESTPPPTAQPPSLSQQGYQTFQRYYHVFRQGELSELVRKLPRVNVREEYYDHDNWCVLAEKLGTDDHWLYT